MGKFYDELTEQERDQNDMRALAKRIKLEQEQSNLIIALTTEREIQLVLTALDIAAE